MSIRDFEDGGTFGCTNPPGFCVNNPDACACRTIRTTRFNDEAGCLIIDEKAVEPRKGEWRQSKYMPVPKTEGFLEAIMDRTTHGGYIGKDKPTT